MTKNSLDDITVLSYFGRCKCGNIIPYGKQSCLGHSRIREPYIKTCYICMGQTYLYKGKHPQIKL